MRKIIIILITFTFLFCSCSTQKMTSEPSVLYQQKDFDSLLRQGYVNLSKKDYNAAISQFTEATNLNPRSARAFNLLGMAYFLKKRYRKAEEQFDKALSLNKIYKEAYCNRGNVYWVKGKLKKAEKMFREAIRLSSDDASAYYNLGSLLISQGKIEEGYFYLSKSVEVDPTFFEKQKLLTVYISEASIKDPEVFFMYAKFYASLGNLEKTVDYLESAERSGFKNWARIKTEEEFKNLRDHDQIKKFIKD